MTETAPVTPAAVNVSPFIIWTLQRTGGTNLARRLFEASKLPGTNGQPLRTGTFLDSIADQWKLHEPFNFGDEARPFGFASEDWLARGDRAALDATTEAVCRARLPLKHCVEMVPWEVTESLLLASTRHGYRHVFLYRHDPLRRLLSMEFARRSGIWGPNQKAGGAPDEVVFAEPLPAESLVEHEKRCSELLERAWTALTQAGQSPLPLAYEDIYQNDEPALVRAHLIHLIEFLAITEDIRATDRLITRILAEGDQGTRARYDSFNGITRLASVLKTINLFKKDHGGMRLRARRVGDYPRWLLQGSVDNMPAMIWPHQKICVGGVVVLAADAPENCQLRLLGRPETDSQWGVTSPIMARKFPTARNGENARFWFEDFIAPTEGPLPLQLVAGDYVLDLYHLTPGQDMP